MTHCENESGHGRFTGQLAQLTQVRVVDAGPVSSRRWAPAAPALLATGYLVTPAIPAGPLWTGALRVLIGGIALLAWFPARPTGAWWWRAPLAGVASLGGTFVLQALAVQEMGAARAAGLVAVTVLPNTALAIARRHERAVTAFFTGGAVLGLWLSLTAQPATAGTDGRWTVPGVLAALGAAACLAGGKELTRRWARPPGVRAVTVTAWQLVGSAVVLVPVAVVLEGPVPALDGDQWGLMLWLAFGATAAAYTVQLGGLAYGVPAAVVSRLAMLTPVLTGGLSWVVAGRVPGVAEAGGLLVCAACIVAGVTFGGVAPKHG